MARRRRNRSSRGLAGVVAVVLLLAALSWLYSVVTENPALSAVVGIIGIGTVAAGIAWWRLREASRRRFRTQTLGELLAMTPAQFEQAVADLLHDLGYQDVRRVGAAGDLHVDVWARDHEGKRVAVQCKRYAPGLKIGSPEMQTFIGMIYRHHQAERGIYVTTSQFSEPAQELARHQRIWLIDGATLTRLIIELDRPAESDKAAAVLVGDSPTVPLP